MATRIVLTQIRGTLKFSTVLLTLLTEVFRGIKEAAERQVLLKFKVDAVEHALAAIAVATQRYREAITREKSSRKRMRELARGAVAFFEALRPEIRGRLPILSKADPTTCYILIDEIVRQTESDAEMAPLALALRRVKDEHIDDLAEVERAESERDDLKIAYNIACLDLDKTVKEVRMYVISNSAKDAPYLKQLKRKGASPKKPVKKAGSETAPEPAVGRPAEQPPKLVQIVESEPKKDDAAA